MVYPGSFHKIVAIGSLYTTETFNFSMNVAPTVIPNSLPAVDTTLANSIATALATWFPVAGGATGPGIISAAKLTSCKVNRIDASGHYQDPETIEIDMGGPISGAGSALVPAQLACAVTLATDVERGLASKGRFFLPPLQYFASLGSDGRLSTENAGNLASACAILIDAINLVYDGDAKVVVASDIGAGMFRNVTEVRIGRVPDTMRSRRSSLSEDAQVSGVQ